jgi:tape measure domain-containing protein
MGGSVGALRQKLNLLRTEKDWIPQKNITSIRRYNTEIKKLEKQITRLDSINGSRMKTWANQAMGQIPMAGLLTNPLVIAGAVAGKAIKNGIQQEMQTTSFEVLLGSADAAKKLVDDIKTYAAKTPFEKAGLGQAAQLMLGYGIAQDKVMPNMKMLGDIAMGDANKLQSLTLAFSQVQSTGRLTGNDLLQMINAGFNPLGTISEQTGKTVGELKKEMEKGAISAQMVEQAFKSATGPGGKFNNMAEKMSQTLGGKLSTLMDSFNDILLKLYNIIAPVLHPALEGLMFVLDSIMIGFDYLRTKIQEGNPVLIGLAVIIGAVATSMAILATVQKAQTIWASAVTPQLAPICNRCPYNLYLVSCCHSRIKNNEFSINRRELSFTVFRLFYGMIRIRIADPHQPGSVLEHQ